MSGEELKKKLNAKGYTTSIVATKLGKRGQDINQIFSKTADVKTGFLESLCTALNLDMNFFYGGTEYLPDEVTFHMREDKEKVPMSLFKEILAERDKYMIEINKKKPFISKVNDNI